MSSVGYATLQVIPSLKGLASSVTSQLNSQMTSAGTTAGQKMGDAAGTGFLANFTKHVASIATGVLVAQGVKQIADFMGDAFIGFNSQMQTANVGFTTMLGSAKKAGDFLDQLTNFAAKTPFDTTDILNYGKQLLAMGINANDIVPDLTAIGDAAAGLGGGTETVQELARALGQMSAKGKVQSDEILQMTEAGVPALQILANSYGVTTGQMQSMITAGKVMSSKAVPAIIKGLEDGTATTEAFGGMMAAQSKTFSGAWENIKDTATKAIGEATLPLFNKLSDAMVNVSNIVQGPGFANFSKFLAQKVSDGFAVAADGVGKFVTWVKSVDWSPLADAIGNVKDAFVQLGPPLLALFKSQAGAGGGLFQTLIDTAPAVGAAVKAVSDVLVGLINFMTAHQTTTQVFAAALVAGFTTSKVIETVTSVVGGFTKLIGIVKDLTALAELATGIRSVADAFAVLDVAMDANPIGAIIVAIAALVAAIVVLEVKFHFMETAWDATVVAWQAVAAFFSGPFLVPFQAIGDFFSGPFLVPFQAIGDFFSGPFLVPFQAVGNFFTTTIPAMLATAVGFFTSLPGEIGDAIAAIPGIALNMLETLAFDFGFGVGEVVKEFLALPGQISGIAGDVASFLSGWAVKLWNDEVAGWKLIISGIVGEAKALPGQIEGIANSVVSFLTGWGSTIKNDAVNAWHSAVNGAINEWHALPGQVSSVASSALHEVESLGSSVISAVESGFHSAVTGGINAFKALPGQAGNIAKSVGSAVKSAVSDAGSWLVSAGKDAVAGLIHGVEDAGGAIGGIFADLAHKAEAGFKAALGIHSPSRVFAQIGQNTVAGFVNGVNAVAPKAVGAVANMLGAANAVLPNGQAAAVGSTRTLNYFAAPGSGLSAEEDLFAAGRRARLVF